MVSFEDFDSNAGADGDGEGGNPDRAARPSITAQLKEAAHRSEAPKEPDKIKHNKSHEDR